MKKIIGYIGISTILIGVNVAPMIMKLGAVMGIIFGLAALALECAVAALMCLFVKWIVG